MEPKAPSPILSPLKPLTVLIELVFVVLVAIFAVTPYLDLDKNTRVGGIELEYLTRTAYSVSFLLHEKGYLPLWQPYLEFGDPLLENPVSFALNPMAFAPSYFFGLYSGVKLTLLLVAISAGIGGWVLARVLGLGMVARLLLACLSIGKGNLHSFLAEGHFPLTLSQAYFPWVFAAVVAILKGHRRWSFVLLMVAYVFVFWSGVPWYPPAIALSIGILTLFGIVEHVPASQEARMRFRIAWTKLGKVMLAVVATFLLSAALMLPLLTKADNIGESLIFEDHKADILGVIGLNFSNVKDMFGVGIYPQGAAFSYYSYMSPLWYALLIAALLVITVRLRKKPLGDLRFVLGFLALFLFTTLWGAGQNPIIMLFYQTIPYANEFRHVQRVLAVASLALIVLLAMGFDVVWRGLVQTPLWIQQKWVSTRFRRIAARVSLGALLLVTSGVAGYDVVRQWHVTWGEHFTQPEGPIENACITWLRQTYPDRPLSVWTLAYKNIYTYLRNEVRHGWVASDFYHIRSIPSTIFAGSIQPGGIPPRELLPEFAMGITHFDEAWLAENGYVAMEESINPYTEGRPCIYRRDGAYSYAWWSSRSALQSYTGMFPVTETNPITNFVRDYDRILVVTEGRSDEDVVVTVQEVAYPGWQVFINDEPAQLESVGGQIGVVLPRSDQPYAVVFRYLPQRFLVGSIITLITALTAILYLLRVDQVLSHRFGQRLNLRPQAAVLPRSQWRERVTQMLDPETQRPDDR